MPGDNLVDKEDLIHAIEDSPELEFKCSEVQYAVSVIKKIIRDFEE